MGQVVYFSSRSPAKTTANEDALAVIPVNESTIVLVVADGLGGPPAGETASRITIETLVNSLKRVSQDETHIRGAILDGIEQANEIILGLRNGSATTVVVTVIQDHILRSYHAGDSMIMLMGNRGKIKHQTVSHSPTGYALESGLINESEAMQHEDRHLISNFIGSTDMRVEIGPNIRFAQRDTLILASDGLSDNLYDHEIVNASRKGPLMQGAKRLVAECKEYMEHPKGDGISHPDDLTFVLFRLRSNK
jgi:serine/threonine protein phosphatase PrpC